MYPACLFPSWTPLLSLDLSNKQVTRTPCCFPFVRLSSLSSANAYGDSLAGAPSIAVFQAYMMVACFLAWSLSQAWGLQQSFGEMWLYHAGLFTTHRMPRMKFTSTSEFLVCSDSHKLFTGVSWSHTFQIISLLKERLISPRIEFKEDFSIKKKKQIKNEPVHFIIQSQQWISHRYIHHPLWNLPPASYPILPL